MRRLGTLVRYRAGAGATWKVEEGLASRQTAFRRLSRDRVSVSILGFGFKDYI